MAEKRADPEAQRLGPRCGVEVGRPWSCQTPIQRYELRNYCAAKRGRFPCPSPMVRLRSHSLLV